MDLLEGLIDNKTLSILKVFLDNPEEFFHIKKVSEVSKVPLATTFRLMKKLHENKIIENKKISKFKIYTLKDNKRTRQLRKIL